MIHLLLGVIYLSFVSLGLPDGLLGAGWPAMYTDFGVPLSAMGIVSMIIAAGTMTSSLASDRLTKRFGAGRVTAVSVAMTAAALFGFSMSSSFVMLLVWAVPYGIGAGAVDAALNNYVAVHYKSRHMSWLHCMWGLGAALGPYMMGLAISGAGWQSGYSGVGWVQTALTAILFLSLPLWKKNARTEPDVEVSGTTGPLALRAIVRLPGAVQMMLIFFAYTALEQTAMLWASSYAVLATGLDMEAAAFFGSLFLIGITAGRFASGFLTMKLSDGQMVRTGFGIIAAGIVLMLIPGSRLVLMLAFLLVGLGCAPVYPSILHITPKLFGARRSQAIIGVEIACAYAANLSMPPLFGIIAQTGSVSFLPLYLLIFLAVQAVAFSVVLRVSSRKISPRGSSITQANG